MRLLLCLVLFAGPALGAEGWRRPFIADVFFYWYRYDPETEWGWDQGVHFTPLYGYYDSTTFDANRHSLWLASEWGMTHHYIDYWAPTWKGEDGEMREKTVFRAAEALRRDGYDIAMAYYQDGDNFAMDAFSKNVSERRDVHQWLRDFAPSPVMPRVGRERKPMQLVYSRNGRPKLTATDAGYRAWLRERYETIGALNQAWDAGRGRPAHRSFDELRLDFGFGRARADSIRYQYHVWRQEWAKLEGLVRDGLEQPGVFASFDIGYQPFLGWGRSDFFRVFGGPHSYGGIFGQPHDQDAHRFLCSALAKKHDTVFLDHLKHCYHDWNIRVPGSAYLPEPHHYDRFWVGNLMRFNEGVLHLSWNEWWEGSNLEPSMELGKTYCEKNLFYATLMKRCFPSIRDWGKGAPIALILNDWHLLTAEGKDDDLFAAMQALRRLGARFDIIPEERVTADALEPFQLVIAPGCDSGFGENSRREDIQDVLLAWCRGGQGRKLWASANARLAAAAGLKPPPAKQTAERGKDFNLFLDVGSEGDEAFLLGGASHREDWGKLPEGKFGAGTNLTMRWTPGSGTRTRFALPVAPHRDHALRLGGSALIAHRVDVLVGGRRAGTLALKPGLHDYELRIPAALVGGRQQATVALRYEKPVIPRDIDPARHPTEGRACNLAIDWLQWSTANVAKGDKRTTYKAPKLAIRFVDPVLGPLKGEAVPSAGLRAMPLAAPGAKPLSLQQPGDVARDILLPLGKGELLYVNGSFSDLVALGYWENLLTHWAKLPPALHVIGHDAVMSARLDAADTVLLLACNHDIAAKGQKLSLRLPVRDVPLSEALILSRDDQTYQPLKARTVRGHVVADDILNYYGIYQLAFAPVRVTVPKLEVCQGEKATVTATVENLTDQPVQGTIRVACIVPTLGGPPAQIALKPRETKQLPLTLQSSKLCDWGTKTVTLELAFAGRRACLFRPCLVFRRPDIQRIDSPVIIPQAGGFALMNRPRLHAVTAAAEDIQVSLGSAKAHVPKLESDRRLGLAVIKGASVKLPMPREPSATPELRPAELDVSYRAAGGKRVTKKLPVQIGTYPEAFDAPADAVRPIIVFNPRDTWLDHAAVSFHSATPGKVYVRTAEGRIAPSWLSLRVQSKRLKSIIWLFALVPPKSARLYFVCHAETPPGAPGPLRVRPEGLGTRSGKLAISNAHVEVLFEERHGGTITRLVSKRTGRQYAAESFGAAFGTFHQYDPLRPVTNTARFVRDELTRQADSATPVTLTRHDPTGAEVKVKWDHPCAAAQWYVFRPWEAGFRLLSTGQPTGKPGDELVLVDARFRAEHFTKSYPNFVGIVNDKEQPHFGWRRGAWVPDCLTFMHPPDFTESISLLNLEYFERRVSRVRHGFWPAKRPQAGKCTYAQAEYVSTSKDYQSGVGLEVLLHRGHHLHAKRRQRQWRERYPVVVEPEESKWGKRFKPVDVEFPKDWFSPYWHARMVVAVPDEKGWVAVATKNLAEKLGGRPKAFRCVQANAENDLAEREFEVGEDGERVVVDVDPRWGRTLHVYGSLEALPSPLMLRRTRAGIPLERFETATEGWQLAGVQRGAFGREGSKGIRVRVGEGGEPVLVSNGAVAVMPEAEYRLTLWARTKTEGAALRTNFFSGAKHDFGQVHIPLEADGKWHRCEATVRAGRFPPSVRPVFRLWALGRPQVIDVDDLELTSAVAAPPALAPSGVEVLR